MAFNWVSFLRQYHIEYVEEGPSVVRGNIAVRCPFCGSSDPSQHMGIAVEGDRRGNWGCWRNASHRGKSPVKLIQALIGCGFAEAQRIAGIQAPAEFGSDESMVGALKSLMGVDQEDKEIEAIEYPKTFRVVSEKGYGRLFFDYLVFQRGYQRDEVAELVERYDLRFCTTGPFAYRLVLPVNMPGVGLVGWTGRSIIKDEDLRYKSLSEKPETAEKEGMPIAPMNIKDCLFNCERLIKNKKADTLVVVEGPLDALRVDYHGRAFGVRATCLFSKSISQAQEDWLGALARSFRHRLVLLDDDASTDAFSLYARLERYGFNYKTLDHGDPAEMTPKQIRLLGALA